MLYNGNQQQQLKQMRKCSKIKRMISHLASILIEYRHKFQLTKSFSLTSIVDWKQEKCKENRISVWCVEIITRKKNFLCRNLVNLLKSKHRIWLFFMIRILPILHIDYTANNNIKSIYAILYLNWVNKKLKINFGFICFNRFAVVKEKKTNSVLCIVIYE